MTTASPISASPTKLRNGTWGATAKGTARKGDTLQITAKSGKSWTATVSAVVWSGNGVTICATESTPAPAGKTRRNGSNGGRVDCRKYGWDGVVGSSSYYSSGQYDEDS